MGVGRSAEVRQMSQALSKGSLQNKKTAKTTETFPTGGGSKKFGGNSQVLFGNLTRGGGGVDLEVKFP